MSPSVFRGVASPASSRTLRVSPNRRDGISTASTGRPQSPSGEPTTLASLARSIALQSSSPPRRQHQQMAAQIQTGMVLHRTKSGALESGEVSARSRRKDASRNRSVGTDGGQMLVSPQAATLLEQVRQMRDGWDCSTDAAATAMGAKKTIGQLPAAGGTRVASPSWTLLDQRKQEVMRQQARLRTQQRSPKSDATRRARSPVRAHKQRMLTSY